MKIGFSKFLSTVSVPSKIAVGSMWAVGGLSSPGGGQEDLPNVEQ